MKRTSMIWLIIATCFVLIGGVFFCLTMTVNHWNFSLLDNEKMETATFDINEEFHNISINSDTEDIEFCLSEDGMGKVVCYEREKEKHTVTIQDGTLSIEKMDTRKWHDYISLFSFGSPTITVYLPQAEYASLFIEESTGAITIPKDFLFGSMDISLSTGDVDCSASSSGLLRIETDTGDIHLQNLSAGELDLSVSTGHVDVQSVVCEGNVGVSMSTGKVKLMDVSCKSVRSTGSTGNITMKNVIAAEKISIERSTGDVEFNGCDAGEIFVETDTGDVTGNLLTDKVFIAETDTGKVDVPKTITGGRCEIKTDTGDISIEIGK